MNNCLDIAEYTPDMQILDGTFKTFKKEIELPCPPELGNKCATICFRVYNKNSIVVIDKSDIVIRIADIPNTDHKIVFLASHELVQDFLEFWKINIMKDYFDIIINELSSSK